MSGSNPWRIESRMMQDGWPTSAWGSLRFYLGVTSVGPNCQFKSRREPIDAMRIQTAKLPPD